MRPQRCLYICGHCAAIRDLPRLIERLTREQVSKGRDDAFMAELLRHFLLVNGHDAADAHLLQDTISVAHAILVIHKELQIVPVQGVSLEELFGGGATAAKRRPDEGDQTKAPRKKSR